MYVISLLASDALAVDLVSWTKSFGGTGTSGTIFGFDATGQPTYLAPEPLIQDVIDAQVPGMCLDTAEAGVLIDAAIANQVPGLSLDAAEATALINAAIAAQVPGLAIDGTEAAALINAAIAAQIPGLTLDDAEVGAIVNAAIAAQVPGLSLDATEVGALINAAILAQVPGIASAEIDATVPDLIDDAILEQVPGLAADEIAARVPAMTLDATEATALINAAIAAQVPGMTLDQTEATALIEALVPLLSLDETETSALIDAAILAQVPGLAADEIDAMVPGIVDAAILSQVPGMTLDQAEATVLINAAIAAQVPPMSLDEGEATALIDAAIADQVPDICLDEIEIAVPEILHELDPAPTGMVFGANARVAWTQIGASSAGTSGMMANRIVFNLHIEETDSRTYDQMELNVASASTNSAALALYSLTSSGVPGDLLWYSASINGTPSGAKAINFADGTWTSAGLSYSDSNENLVITRGTEVLLAEQHSGVLSLRVFPVGSARALATDAATGNPYTGWELPVSSFGSWTTPATGAVGRTGSPPSLSLRVAN